MIHPKLVIPNNILYCDKLHNKREFLALKITAEVNIIDPVK